jgi:hypothetical protein
MAYSTIGNITLSNSYPYSTGSVMITGGTGYSGTYTLNTASTNGTWSTTNPYVTVGATSKSALQVQGDAEFKGNVTINGQNLSETLRSIQDRLAILIPDPKLLDKYEALRQAYEHYKTLEALCVEQDIFNE